ncbi:hypothetical protein [Lentzea sp. NPDC059081]|uniref:hypothetical protein n=1 Tax=Lentzea sp. NPDC059081 TaxID=3346719 RepID=UPI0036AAE5C8
MEQRLRELVLEEELVRMLVSRVRESQAAEACGSYLLALFSIGSFVEGVVYSVLISRFPELARDGFPGRKGNLIPSDRVGPEQLLDIAHDRSNRCAAKVSSR